MDFVALEQLETGHLEWLAVFLSVPDWSPESTDTKAMCGKEEDLEKAPYNSTVIALDNLRAQLGLSLSSSMSGAFCPKFIPSFPVFKGILQRTFWRNGNVLEVSVHVDNMLALSIGSQYAFMLERKKETENIISTALNSLGISDLNDVYASEVKKGQAQTNASSETIQDEEYSAEGSSV